MKLSWSATAKHFFFRFNTFTAHRFVGGACIFYEHFHSFKSWGQEERVLALGVALIGCCKLFFFALHKLVDLTFMIMKQRNGQCTIRRLSSMPINYTKKYVPVKCLIKELTTELTINNKQIDKKSCRVRIHRQQPSICLISSLKLKLRSDFGDKTHLWNCF